MGKNRRQTKELGYGTVADLLTRLESEAQKVVRRLMEKAEESSRDLKENVADLIDQVKSEGLYQVASEKRDEITKGLSQVLARAREIQFGNFNGDLLIREAKKNLGDWVDKIQTQVFAVLSIPSQDDVVRLSRKITTLEQRVSKLKRKAA